MRPINKQTEGNEGQTFTVREELTGRQHEPWPVGWNLRYWCELMHFDM